MVFYLSWARGFPRKNRVFIILLNFCFLLYQEQPIQTGSQAVCENFAKIEKTQFTPLLCFVLSNLTGTHHSPMLKLLLVLKQNTIQN